MKKLFILFMFFAIPLSAQTILTQPTDQTVLVGQSATFNVTLASGTCRSLWLINGAGKFGSMANSISYVIPNTLLMQNGTTVQVQLFGCTAGNASLLSNKVRLTVSAVPLNINLAISGALTFEDGTAVFNGQIIIQQWNGTLWMPAGNVASDINGVLSGVFTINPNWADVDGNVEFQWSVAGLTGSTAVSLLQFQQGSTGIVVKLVLFKSPFLTKLAGVTKSSSIALIP